jgi:hypothetical protein
MEQLSIVQAAARQQPQLHHSTDHMIINMTTIIHLVVSIQNGQSHYIDLISYSIQRQYMIRPLTHAGLLMIIDKYIQYRFI